MLFLVEKNTIATYHEGAETEICDGRMFMMFRIISAALIGLALSGPALALEVTQGTKYETYANEGTDSVTINVRENAKKRKIYVIVSASRLSVDTWFDITLQKDGVEVNRVRTTSGHVREDKNYDTTFRGTIPAGGSPSFTAKVVQDRDINPNMSAKFEMDIIVVHTEN